ncbi:Y-family DNA polymerase [Aureimonas leprariae]|uniref:DNA polymerase Y family protein n=1 Tax=Plantimonas leprariae TaxID=2615207 RepID=A0A7V7PKN3_9HYPH|nr:DNA polymerase Y family protein [Aureimonas leprariae]KAB0676299.1 DNA polymerase Y family protein [Aureimonas leprariae]
MTRVVSLWLPRWPTDRLRRTSPGAAPPADVPLVLVGRDGNRRTVVALDHIAEAAGLSVGMPTAKAQALVPGLAVIEADPAGDAAALERLAIWALRFSPVVAADPPDGLVIETTGADHLHGGEETMLAKLVERFAASGMEARVAVADTWGAAHAAARFAGAPMVIVDGRVGREALAGLPVTALRLAARTVVDLNVLGFRTIGDVASQPRAPLTQRFGPTLGHRLDQAFGVVPEPVDPVRSPDLVEVRRAFPEPIGAPETVARYTGKLVAALCAELELRGLGARRLDLLFTRVDNRVEAIRVGTGQPVRDVRQLTRLLASRIETVDPGFGIDLMRLAATLAEPLGERQAVSPVIEEPVVDVAGLIDVLANRLGERRLYRFAPVASDVPERSIARIGALDPDDGAAWHDHWPRPSRLLPRPELVETMALLPDHPPNWFRWRGVRRRVRRADGPERVFGEWWKRDAEIATARDYFRVEDDAGERYWLYREGDGEHPETGSQRWFLHGIFG